MIECVLGGKIRRGQIVVAVGDMHFEIWVHADGFAKSLAHVDVLILKFGVTPRSIQPRAYFVLQIIFVFQIVTHVVVKRGGIRPRKIRARRIEFGKLARRVAVNAGEARIEPPHRAPLIAQQFFAEAVDLDAEVGAINVVFAQAGVGGQFFDHGCAVSGGQP